MDTKQLSRVAADIRCDRFDSEDSVHKKSQSKELWPQAHEYEYEERRLEEE